MKYNYTYDNLVKTFGKSLSHQNEVVYVTGNLTYLGKGDFSNKKELLEGFYRALLEVCGSNVTIIVPSFTQNLANTNIPFNLKKTKATSGIFPNYILQKRESVRSFHPFTSFTAIGPKADYICTNNLKHPYGIDSPFERILTLKNPVVLSIGMEPNSTSSMVHHVETVMNVPYRYTKEFFHPIEYEKNVIIKELFYLPVLYREMDIVRDKNRKIFDEFTKKFTIKNVLLGKSTVYTYNLHDFYISTLELFKKDIYAWLQSEPKVKPYRY